MRVHPLKQEGDHWACRSCDCEAERAVSYFSLKVPLGFPIAANFACYDLEVRENVAIGCKGAVLVSRAFKATEVLADAPKLTAKQKEDLVKCAGQHRLLLPGTRHEYEFFQKFDKLTGGSHFATRRAALRYMTYPHLQMALALFALGFSSARLLHSYAAYARRRHAKESRLVRLPAVWGEFESVEALNLVRALFVYRRGESATLRTRALVVRRSSRSGSRSRSPFSTRPCGRRRCASWVPST